jgi:hypothetical protein
MSSRTARDCREMLIRAFMTVFLGNPVIKNPGFYIIMTGSAFMYSRQTVVA